MTVAVATLAAAIIGVVANIGVTSYQELIGYYGSKARSKLNQVIKKLSEEISKNNQLKEQLTNAYNSKNSALLSSIMYGSGFGPRAKSLQKELDQLDANYKAQAAVYDNKITAANSKINEAQTASNYAGTSISGNSAAEKVLNEHGMTSHTITSSNPAEAVKQAIGGGITNA